MQSVTSASATELLKLQPIRRFLLVLRRCVIAFFALGALQNYIVSRHFAFSPAAASTIYGHSLPFVYALKSFVCPVCR